MDTLKSHQLTMTVLMTPDMANFSGKVGDDLIEKLIRKHFDLRPYGITKMLDLEHPIYQPTASYGHFGRKPKEISYTDGAGKKHTATAFSWEKTDRAEALRKDAKL